MSQSESPRDFYHRLENGLSPLIRLMLAEHLPKIGGRKWWEACVLSSLTPIQLEYVREPENLEQFDFPALVNIVHHKNWRTLRPSLGIGNEFTNYLFSLKTLRNEVEHRPDLVLDDERRRHIEQSARLAMRLLNKDETTDLFEPLHAARRPQHARGHSRIRHRRGRTRRPPSQARRCRHRHAVRGGRSRACRRPHGTGRDEAHHGGPCLEARLRPHQRLHALPAKRRHLVEAS